MSSHQPATSPSDRPLPESTDIVVVGGGIVGICTALFLAERGVRVCVCEK
ncbi:MAG: FAD-dependent oxidoreductase, partial [Rhodobacteraceae bacterium]|nr:FAD-dependent oxidoreductase [Paracoccaceae bacterium]